MMLGDILFITRKHENTALTIFDKVNEEFHPKYLIAVSGEVESGKSEIAHILGKLLKNRGKEVKILNMDNFYKIPPKERLAWRKEKGIGSVGIDEYDWKTISRIIRDFKNGKKSNMPVVDLISGNVDQLTTDFINTDILIFNGLYSVNIDECDLRVFIELTYEDTSEAQKASGNEILDDFRTAIMEREHEALQELKPKANYFVDFDTSLELFHL